jgi:hypothetical protein
MNSKNKKAEVSQMFMYLTAAIVIGFTLLFAGKAIITLIDNIDVVEAQQFRGDFEAAINEVSSKYGSVQFKTLRGLRDFETICVVDLDWARIHFAELPPDLSQYTLIRGDLKDETANVFLITDNVKEKLLNVKLDVAEGYACQEVSNSGDIQIKLEGFGNYARLSFVS